MKRTGFSRTVLGLIFLAAYFFSSHGSSDELLALDDDCVVSVLNRTVRADASGGFSMPNIPSNMGQVRARAVCQRDDVTVSAETDYFAVVTNGIIDTGDFFIREGEPVPQRLTVAGGNSITLGEIGATFPLQVTAEYAVGDPEPATEGVNYTPSTPTVVSVDTGGIITAESPQ